MRFTRTNTGNQSAQPMLDTAGKATGPDAPAIDVEITGTATSVDVSIADDDGTFFSVTGVNATTAGGLKYKVDNAAFGRNGITGNPKVTTANISNAAHTAIVKLWTND